MALQEGEQIGPYTITGVLGRGGMATVYRASHGRLERDVAIKVMHASLMQDDSFIARFEREARIVARLEHPNIVPIYDYNEHESEPYLVMKLIPGTTLKRFALKQGMTLEETAEMMSQLANALDYAHGQNILHRDLKPSNILVDEHKRPYLTDFGLARLAQSGESTMSRDMMLGTPYYISPEQAQGGVDIDHRTDIYAFGVILYELICGHIPFSGDTPYAIVHGHIYEAPVPPSQRNPNLPPAIDAVILRALAKDRNQRYDSASAMMQAFRQALANADEPALHSAVTPVDLPPLRHTTPPQKPKNVDGNTIVTDSQGKRMQLERSFDLANIDFSGIGKRIESGVQNLAAIIEDSIDSELRQRGLREGEDEESRLRRSIAKRMKARSELAGHLAVYLAINAGLWMIWLFTGAGFPWPLFPTFFWGIGVVAQIAEYYEKYGPGRQRREEAIERELQRERERITIDKPKKNKNDEEAFSLSQIEDAAPRVRLNEEGELTDSFIHEIDREQRQRRR